ncbi:hypothetical protein BBJ29_005906 [Phytophthora kernoviae]|uniref:Uncharacterized protein n=1 Tax=Phytophthora kernoviae TaxID=325452 RepID=A0A3F2RJ95_9STRA|nr:hypothetical protein BBP00_00007118 [Phytophthora kernoviae]RLN70943.1 hypothetical protein BBJ29_005906 [Phytophthora kernoviae]
MNITYKFLLVSALAATVVNGHGWLSKPESTFNASAGDKSQFIGSIDSSATFKGNFGGPPVDNVAAFTKAFKASKYKTLKALIDDKTKISVPGATLTCGLADPDAAPQPLPAKLEWAHSDSEGFTSSHEGPCEAWCDATRVFHDENCAAHFKTAPAVMPYEKSKCSGAKKLTFFWIAMHGPSWQVYVNCATLSGGSSDDAQQNQGSTPTANTPQPANTPQTGNTGENQYWSKGGNQNWGGTNTATKQGGATNTGSTNYGFNSFQNQGWTKAGTVAPSM